MNVSKGGEVSIIAKAHTDVDIHTMKVAFFDDTRYPLFRFVGSVLECMLHFCAYINFSVKIQLLCSI